ncbi:MAG: hypothetical protein KJ955_00870 [Nanoarchaeota archaeon]|nr:hypothetical protein [Nanoarchaeota archaeon]
MDNLLIDLRNLLERLVEASNSEEFTNIAELVEPENPSSVGSFFICISAMDEELYAAVKKQIRTYVFRESFVNNRRLGFIIETMGDAREIYNDCFPGTLEDGYIDFYAKN